MAKGKGISKLAADAFIIKAEEARGELATCDKEIDKINTKIVDFVMQNKGGILSVIHFLAYITNLYLSIFYKLRRFSQSLK